MIKLRSKALLKCITFKSDVYTIHGHKIIQLIRQKRANNITHWTQRNPRKPWLRKYYESCEIELRMLCFFGRDLIKNSIRIYSNNIRRLSVQSLWNYHQYILPLTTLFNGKWTVKVSIGIEVLVIHPSLH